MPEPYTFSFLRETLGRALALGFRFTDYGMVRRGLVPSSPYAILRHDVDYCLDPIAPMSALEYELGIRATYCFLAETEGYAIESQRGEEVISNLLARRHAIGLHYDATSSPSDAAVVDEVERIAERWETRFGIVIDAVSFHMAGRRSVAEIILRSERVNTYSPQLTHLHYISDSNQHSRIARLEEVFSTHAAVHLLLHPIWWRSERLDFFSIVEELATARGRSVEEILTPEQIALHGLHRAAR